MGGVGLGSENCNFSVQEACGCDLAHVEDIHALWFDVSNKYIRYEYQLKVASCSHNELHNRNPPGYRMSYMIFRDNVSVNHAP
jgi:hypothetical protein